MIKHRVAIVLFFLTNFTTYSFQASRASATHAEREVSFSNILKDLAEVKTGNELRNVITYLSSYEFDSSDQERQVVEKVTLVLLTYAEHHVRTALHTFSNRIALVEQKKDSSFLTALCVKPHLLLVKNDPVYYQKLHRMRDHYFYLLGLLAQVKNSTERTQNLYGWVSELFTIINQLRIKKNIVVNTAEDVLQHGYSLCELIQEKNKIFCKKKKAMPLPNLLPRWGMRNGPLLAASAGAGYAMHQYLKQKYQPGIDFVRNDYRNFATHVRDQGVAQQIPRAATVSDAQINEAAENLDMEFLNQRVIPVLTNRDAQLDATRQSLRDQVAQISQNVRQFRDQLRAQNQQHAAQAAAVPAPGGAQPPAAAAIPAVQNSTQATTVESLYRRVPESVRGFVSGIPGMMSRLPGATRASNLASALYQRMPNSWRTRIGAWSGAAHTATSQVAQSPARTALIGAAALLAADYYLWGGILPFGLEYPVAAATMAGSTALLDQNVSDASTFVTRNAQIANVATHAAEQIVDGVADASGDAAGAVNRVTHVIDRLSDVPAALNYFIRIPPKKGEVALTKYGGIAAGVGLAALLYTAKRAFTRKDCATVRLSQTLHALVNVLSPYNGKANAMQMKPADLGAFLHYIDIVCRNAQCLSYTERKHLKRDIALLESMQVSLKNKLRLIDSMHQTYNLATVR